MKTLMIEEVSVKQVDMYGEDNDICYLPECDEHVVQL